MQEVVPGEPVFSFPRATQGYYDVRRENDANMELMLFVTNSLRSILKEVGT